MSGDSAATGTVERPPLAQHDSSILDLAFAMDCTGSMGSYIRNAQQSIRSIVETIVANEKSDIRLALVEYRDHPPQDSSFVTRVHDFTPSVSKMKKDLDACSASGGGDCPEAVADALHQVSKLSWRKEATKICVFIADAPPHGLGVSGDGFPNGCPDNLDPMEVIQTLAQMSVTLYMVGCEPSIRNYRDFFMALAHTTGGQYVPLRNAQLLSQVIIGGAQEEISLDRLISEAEAEVEEDVMAHGGWEAVSDDYLSRRVMDKMNSRGVQVQQLQSKSAAIPEASSKAKKWSGFKNLSEVRSEYVLDHPETERDYGMMRSTSASFTKKSKKSSGILRSMMSPFRGRMAPSASGPMMRSCAESAPRMEAMDWTMDGAEEDDTDSYTVASKSNLDMQQASRMATKMKNRRK